MKIPNQIRSGAKTPQEARDFETFKGSCVYFPNRENGPYVIVFIDGSTGYYDLFSIDGEFVFCIDQ